MRVNFPLSPIIGRVSWTDWGVAFASQSVYCIQKVGLDPEKVNPNGGAIAIGRTFSYQVF